MPQRIMIATTNEKNILEYFRSNIFESIAAYEAWKMMYGSRSTEIVSPEFAQRYVKIQGYHPDFFGIATEALLTQFVMYALHPFDRRSDVMSLHKVDRQASKEFVNNNKVTLGMLKKVRDELFAHRKNNAVEGEYKIPSFLDMDQFFKNLIEFYNVLTRNMTDSGTNFDNAFGVKRDIERLFMNLERGETARMGEIEIKYRWEMSDKKASDIL